jgi:hypothetical protein
MYGIINRAIEDLVTENFGAAKWEAIKKRSGVNVEFFISTEPYNDDLTYKLANAVADELHIPLNEVLVKFGEWWVLNTANEKYKGLMSTGGDNLKEFLLNLPVFHNRIMLMYPKLTPPEFKVSDVESNSICLHYFSKRQGLQEFVRGLLMGLGKMYNTKITIELIQSRTEGSTHEIFKVIW